MRRIPMTGLALALTLGAAPMLAAQSVHGREPGQRSGWQQQDPGQRFRQALFRGVDLSPAQKARLERIQARYQEQTRALRERMRPELQAARGDHQRGDDADARAVFQHTGHTREQMRQIREREIKDIRGVLNRDQRRTFDANVKQMRERMKERADQARKNGQRSGRESGQWSGRDNGQGTGHDNGQQHGQNGHRDDRGPRR